MVKINLAGRKIEIDAKKATPLGMFLGLMFRSKNTKNILFEFRSSGSASIHSFFVFFPFLAVWLDDENNLIDCSIVRPFTVSVSPKHPAKFLIEIPLNKENNPIIKMLDGRKDLNTK